jgi:NtrC-family two-component system sensor histidine kinase KinB
MSSSEIQTIRHLQQENLRLRSDNSYLRDYVERLHNALTALVKLQQSIEMITPQTNVFQLIYDILNSSLDAVESENGSLLLLDEETRELVFVEVLGESREKLLNYRLPEGVGVAGWVVENMKPRLVENTSVDPAFSPVVDQYTGLRTTSLVCIPLMDGGRRLGAIEAVNTRSGRPFTEADMEVMQLVGRLASTAIVEAEKASGG